MKHNKWIKPVVLIAILVTLISVARVFGFGEKLGELKGWIADQGFWGPFMFAGIYAVTTVAAIPIVERVAGLYRKTHLAPIVAAALKWWLKVQR